MKILSIIISLSYALRDNTFKSLASRALNVYNVFCGKFHRFLINPIKFEGRKERQEGEKEKKERAVLSNVFNSSKQIAKEFCFT